MINALVIDKDGTRRPEQAYFCKKHAAVEYQAGIALPLEYQNFTPVIQNYRQIIDDAVKLNTSLNSSYGHHLRAHNRIGSHAQLFTNHYLRHSFILYTDVDFYTNTITSLRSLNQSLSLKYYTDTDIRTIFEDQKRQREQTNDLKVLRRFSEKYQESRAQIFQKRELNSRGKKINNYLKKKTLGIEEQHGMVSAYYEIFGDQSTVTIQEFKNNFKPQVKDFIPAYETGDTMRRSVTSACALSTTQYAEKNNIPLLTKNDRYGIVTTTPLNVRSLACLSAPFRDFFKAHTACQVMSHMLGGKPAFSQHETEEMKFAINEAVFVHGMRL